MNDEKVTAAAAAIEQILLAEGERLNPIFVGIERKSALALMPSLYHWLKADAKNGADVFLEPTGRDPFISVSTTEKTAGQVYQEIEEIRQSYFDESYSPGPIIFICDNRSYDNKPMCRRSDLDRRSFDIYSMIASALSFVGRYSEQRCYLACDPTLISPNNLQSFLGGFKDETSHWETGLDWQAPTFSLILSERGSSEIAVCNIRTVLIELDTERRSLDWDIRTPSILIHRSQTHTEHEDRTVSTPMFSIAHLPAMTAEHSRNETIRFLKSRSGQCPRNDSDHLIDVRRVAHERQWTAAGGCEKISYRTDPSKFGLPVGELASYLSASISSANSSTASNSTHQVAVSLGPNRTLTAFRLPSNDLPPDDTFFCFSLRDLSPQFIVDYLNTSSVQDQIVAMSSGSWTNPTLSQFSIDNIHVPAVAPNDYLVIKSKIETATDIRCEIESLGVELETCARRFDIASGDGWENLNIFADQSIFQSMCDDASSVSDKLQKLLKHTISSTVYPPFPIAAAQRSLANCSSDFESMMHQLYYAETIVKTLCFTYATQTDGDCCLGFLKSNYNKRRGVKLTFGQWNQWLRELVIASDLPGSSRQVDTALQRIVEIRNDCSHRTPRNEARAGAILNELKPLVTVLDEFAEESKSLIWVFSTEIVPRRSESDWKGYSLNGDHPEFSRQILTLPSNDARLTLPVHEVHMLDKGNWRSLWPWLVLHKDGNGGYSLYWWEGLHSSGKAIYSPIATLGGTIQLQHEGDVINRLLERSFSSGR